MKITYLFGAGASRNSLPLVTEIPAGLRKIIELLKTNEFKLSVEEKFRDSYHQSLSKKEIQDILIEDLEWLLDKSANHASIDTFAKKLFIKKQRNELNRLKLSFSVYLIIEQFLNKVDLRYDGFYASLLTGGILDFPKHVRILSWNYDMQFEKAFVEYTNQTDVTANQTFLNIITKYGSDKPDNSRFSILKLNGTTNLMENAGWSQYHYFSEFSNELTIDILEKAIKAYAILRLTKAQGFPGLSFAWERFGKTRK